MYLDFETKLFRQTWGNTATGIDETIDGSPVFAGQAFTDAYTTVIHELQTDYYGVFFGNIFAYTVHNPTDKFLADLKNCNMASRHDAKTIY